MTERHSREIESGDVRRERVRELQSRDLKKRRTLDLLKHQHDEGGGRRRPRWQRRTIPAATAPQAGIAATTARTPQFADLCATEVEFKTHFHWEGAGQQLASV